MGRLLKLKTPPWVVLVEEEVPRSVSLAVTVASFRAAPAESSTVPVMRRGDLLTQRGLTDG